MKHLVRAVTGLVLAAGLVSTSPAPSPARTPAPQAAVTAAAGRLAEAPALVVGGKAWVAVSVATLWRSPASPRVVDRPALQRPARIRQWLAAMTTDQRRALNGRADTQALLGDRVRILRVKGDWARVAVPDQPSPRDRRGYPGWVPTRQLTPRPPQHTPKIVTVTGRTAWLHNDTTGTRVLEISFGTRLPYLGSTGKFVRVRTPLGVVRRLRTAAVTVHPRTEPALPRTRRHLVATAQKFTGLPYLWAGASGFGFDCSGLTWLDHRTHGLRIPRDAAPQATRGTPVARTNLRRGDLIFYATNGLVHHVAMYAGDGHMVESPHTGATVRTVPVRTHEYAGARRYLP